MTGALVDELHADRPRRGRAAGRLGAVYLRASRRSPQSSSSAARTCASARDRRGRGAASRPRARASAPSRAGASGAGSRPTATSPAAVASSVAVRSSSRASRSIARRPGWPIARTASSSDSASHGLASHRTEQPVLRATRRPARQPLVRRCRPAADVGHLRAGTCAHDASTSSGSSLAVGADGDGEVPGVHQLVHRRARRRLGDRPLEPRRRHAPTLERARRPQRLDALRHRAR